MIEKTRTVPAIRRIVGRRAYDTTTASVLYHWRAEDPFEMGRALLLNVWGVHFAVSYCYALDSCEDDYERLTPLLTRDEAIDWAEKHCNWLVEDLFGSLPEAGQGDA